jgi:hypothetical protein
VAELKPTSRKSRYSFLFLTEPSPIVRRDLGRALAKIGAHPDSDGHDFELFGNKVFKLVELVEFMYDVKWQTMRHLNTKRTASARCARMDVDLDYFPYDRKFEHSRASINPL